MERKYTTVIGLEVHAQLLTESKAFSDDSSKFGNSPNTNISVITLAHPGTLPKANQKAIEFAIKMGLACGCSISKYNFFDRKNYFYPDLPKGFQITQDRAPICIGGKVPIKLADKSQKEIKLNRIHMEEDAGKSIHTGENAFTQIDLNRAGVALIEIVTEPDIRSAEEAVACLFELKRLVQYLEICDGNMEEGSFRCDANISLMPEGSTEYGKKVEVKNMNSFRYVHKAIQYEVQRQMAILNAGEEVVSETRMFNAEKGTTYGLRNKETLNDYRYFPEPDLQPIVVSEEMLESIKRQMPELPQSLENRFSSKYQLQDSEIAFLTEHKETAQFFESIVAKNKSYKPAANWMMGPIRAYMKDNNIGLDAFPIKGESIGDLIDLIEINKVPFTHAAQLIFPKMLESGKEAKAIAEELGLLQTASFEGLDGIILDVLEQMPEKVKEYKSGKKGLLGLFVGEVKKRTQGKADPKIVSEMLEKALSSQ